MVTTTPSLGFASQPGWMPVRAFQRRGQTWLDWAWCVNADFTAPFFVDGLERAMRQPMNQAARPQTALTALDAAETEPYAETARVVIHHVTRCGSTAISRAYAQMANVAAVSEAGVLDDYLHWVRNSVHDEAQTAPRLRQLTSLLLRRGPAPCRFGIIKLDAWQLLDAATWSRAFPDALHVVAVRDPLEVAVSHVRQPGWSTVPGAIAHLHPSHSVEEQCGWGREGYIARTLAVYFSAAEAQIKAGAMAIDYRDLHAAVCDRIPRAARMSLDDTDRAALQASLSVHSKSPSQLFISDWADKRAKIAPTLQREVETHVAPIWRRIQAMLAG